MSSIYGTSLLNNYGLSSLYGNSILGNSQTSNNSLNSIFSMMLLSMLGQSSSSNSLFGNYSDSSNGSSNFLNLFQSLLGNAGKTPVTVDEETVTLTPKEKVYIIGAYNTKKNLTLEDNIKDFYDSGSSKRSTNGGNNQYYLGSNFHNNVSDNDTDLRNLLSKISEEDKNLTFDKGEAYVISESGEVLGTISSSQAAEEQTFFRSKGIDNRPTAAKNSSFRVLNDLGMTNTKMTDKNKKSLIKQYGSEEATGGKIELDGKTYEVASTVVRKYTPLTFDINGDGVKTSDKIIDFDIDGDGKKDKINDVADGTLCIRGGKSGLDLFGDNTDIDGDGKADGFTDGFQALKALATKEGLINGKDDMVLDANDLKKLEEKYGLAMKTNGYNSEAKSLAEIGLTEIDLSKDTDTKRINNFDGQDNDVLIQSGATFKLNGKTRDYADVLHAVK